MLHSRGVGGLRNSTPVHSVAGWIGQFHACGQQAVTAPSPLHFVALERVAATHWEHVEAKGRTRLQLGELLPEVRQRPQVPSSRCRKLYPGNSCTRGFQGLAGTHLHAISTHRIVASLRVASETHVVLTRLTANYLAVGHEQPDKFKEILAHDDVKRLETAAAPGRAVARAERLVRCDRGSLADAVGSRQSDGSSAEVRTLVGSLRPA